MSAWDSFLTGATGLASLVTGGLVPIYGEPEGVTAEQRRDVTRDAAVGTVKKVAQDPLSPLKRGTETVGSVVTGLDLPWYVYAAGIVAVHGMVTGWLPKLVKKA